MRPLPPLRTRRQTVGAMLGLAGGLAPGLVRACVAPGPASSTRAVTLSTLSSPELLMNSSFGAAPAVSPTTPESESHFIVLAWDAPGVGPQLLAMAQTHWAFTDQFSQTLAFRGPLLSDDGQQHAGSLHLLHTADAGLAFRFAQEEPYHRAGLFTEVEVHRFVALQPPVRTAQALPDAPRPHAFVRVRWRPAPCPRRADLRPDKLRPADWLLLGLLVDDAGLCTGVAGVLNGGWGRSPDELAAWLTAAGLPQSPIEAVRWRRGGRP